jgi:hypothetical protein
MALQDTLDAFRANFEAGGAPYNAPPGSTSRCTAPLTS